MKVLETRTDGSVVVHFDASELRSLQVAGPMIHMLCMMTTTPTDPRRVCVQCNQLFVPRRVDQTACSKACRRKIHGPRHPALSRDKSCAICGKAFTDESKTNSVKTCSDECQIALKRQTKNRLRGGPVVTREPPPVVDRVKLLEALGERINRK